MAIVTLNVWIVIGYNDVSAIDDSFDVSIVLFGIFLENFSSNNTLRCQILMNYI